MEVVTTEQYREKNEAWSHGDSRNKGTMEQWAQRVKVGEAHGLGWLVAARQ